ncbi:MAG: hypothetical protein DHS20C16_30200 [Phycisphaerae bacterium]|nr:MAG: hypothetical protein DHS20C16_30200 [Phycisphaerae bacterium]
MLESVARVDRLLTANIERRFQVANDGSNQQMPKGLDIMSFLRARICPVLIASVAFSVFANQAYAVEPYIASITATEVNVRSGPSTNYYIVTKLQAGDRVDVREEDAGWFGIVPPPGCFSLISKHYVDLDGKGGGVVNGNNVRVRAGSSHSKSRYAVQVKLSEGDEVEVLDDGPEGFLKIKSPKGAYAWVHGELVARASEKWVNPDTFVSNPTTPSASAPKPSVAVTSTKPSVSTTPSERIGEAPSAKQSDTKVAVRSEEVAPRQAPESTDRVAVYTWTGESGGTIKRTETNASPPKTNATTTAKPNMTSQSMPPDNQKSVAMVAPKKATSTPQPTTHQSASAEHVQQTSSIPQSTSTAPQASVDSTGQVAIIKWDDATQSVKTSDNPARTSQPATSDTENMATRSTITSPNPQPISSTNAMTTQPMIVQPNSSSSRSDSSVANVTTGSITQHHTQASTVTSTAPTPVQTNTVSVIPYTGVDPRADLKLLHDQVVRELDKPLEQRQFGELMARYRGIMEADVDEASKLYAERRIHQLEVLSIRIGAVGQINNLVTEVVETRQSASQQRSTITTTTTTERPSVGFAATGELRESMVFSSPVGPRRYRLIDPNESVPRTLCYVEIPRDSTIDVSQYLGRIVGVRASRDFVETGNVDPISVLVASSIEPVSSNTSASVSKSASRGTTPMGETTTNDKSKDADQIAIRPMVPAYNP